MKTRHRILEVTRQQATYNEPGDSPCDWVNQYVCVYQRTFASKRKADKAQFKLRREFSRADHYSVMGYADHWITRKAV